MKPPLRTKSVGTKVSEAEFALLEERARRAGMQLGEWVREVPSSYKLFLGSIFGLRHGRIQTNHTTATTDGYNLDLVVQYQFARQRLNIIRNQPVLTVG